MYTYQKEGWQSGQSPDAPFAGDPPPAGGAAIPVELASPVTAPGAPCSPAAVAGLPSALSPAGGRHSGRVTSGARGRYTPAVVASPLSLKMIVSQSSARTSLPSSCMRSALRVNEAHTRVRCRRIAATAGRCRSLGDVEA